MRCQCNKIRFGAGTPGNESKTSAQALTPDPGCLSGLPFSLIQIPDCVSDVQHLMGESATNRIDALPQRFRLFFGPLAHGSAMARCNCNIAVTTQPLVMKGPISKLSNSLLQLGLSIHHDRRRVLEAVCLRRAETGFLLRRPQPLPHRHCRRERAIVRSRIRASLPSISFSVRTPNGCDDERNDLD